MSRRGTSLSNLSGTAIAREIDSKYDVIKEVSNYLVEIEAVATEDLAALTQALNDAKDFTGITVVTGPTASWDAVNKILTVTVEKGDKGDTGATGADGVNNYVHVRYSTDNVGTLMSSSPSGRTHIGILVSDNEVASGAPGDYTWIKYVGRDGNNGADGADGIDGTAGKDGDSGLTPVIEFTLDNDGNLLYEVVGYEDGPTAPADPIEEW